MTHVTCPGCALRFTPAAASTIRKCPFCGGALATQSAEAAFGLQLVEPVVSLADLVAEPTPPPPDRLPPTS